jgi:hypothetical protein
MRIPYISYLIFLLVFACTSCTPKSTPNKLEIYVNIGEQIGHLKHNIQEVTKYSVKISLKNNTDKIFLYWSMSCSWSDNWLTNNDSLVLMCPDCDSNVPFLHKIKPGEIITINGSLLVLPTLNSTDKEYLRLGFIWVKDKEVTLLSDFFKIVDLKRKGNIDIFWSEPFVINTKL